MRHLAKVGNDDCPPIGTIAVLESWPCLRVCYIVGVMNY